MFAYLRALPAPKLLLWCYLIWYGVVVARYFEASLALWGTSLGMSAIIGTGLYVSTAYATGSRRPLGFWPAFRFYLMPFCVSSFAALVKGRHFVLIFHPKAVDNLLALGLCVAFVALVVVAKSSRPSSPVPQAVAAEPREPSRGARRLPVSGEAVVEVASPGRR